MMKILYAIQGTGNGHLSRARDIIPLLQKKGELDILVSGTQSGVELPYPVKWRFKGLSFVFGKKGGVDLYETYKKTNIRKLYKEIKSLPVEDYDLVISDFEPVSSWACYRKNKPCIALSHQSAVIHPRAPQPKHMDIVGSLVLRRYAPATTHYGFHFKSYDQNIYTPVIRQEIRQLTPSNLGHYTVYLPSYSDKRIIRMLTEYPGIQWQVFSRHSTEAYTLKNVSVTPINNEAFIQSLAGCKGVLCGAGFETPAEALFLKKKLLVIPMKKQYEQHCNAAALEEIGVPVMKSLKTKHAHILEEWIKSYAVIEVNYPDITEEIIDRVILQTYTPPVKMGNLKETLPLSPVMNLLQRKIN